MSFLQEVEADLDRTFTKETEFGTVREFLIIEDEEEKVFEAAVVWDEEELKTRMIVQQQGVYMGSVLCFIPKKWFSVAPIAQQIIYSPVNLRKVGWRILDVTEAVGCYEICLDKLLA